jgi:hypothetical protein
MPIPGGFRGHIVVNAANAAGFADDAGGWGAYCRPYCTIPVTLPPTRIEVSVPGIKNDRGKLPADSGAPGAGAGLSWLWPSWSSRCWRSSLEHDPLRLKRRCRPPPSRYAALPPPCPRGRVGVGAGISASTSGDRALAAASAGHFSPLTKFLTSGGFSAGPNKPASVLKYTTISVFSSFTAAGANLSISPPSANA